MIPPSPSNSQDYNILREYYFLQTKPYLEAKKIKQVKADRL